MLLKQSYRAANPKFNKLAIAISTEGSELEERMLSLLRRRKKQNAIF